MDNAEFDKAVAEVVAAAIAEEIGSVNGAAKRSGIPYATLDRRLKDGSFTVRELRRLAEATGRKVADFIPRESDREAA